MASPKKMPPGKYAAIPLIVIDTPAWREMSTAAHSLFLWFVMEFHGPKFNNNRKIKLSVRQAAERMGVSKDTASRAFRDLQAKGFIKVIKGGSLGVSGHGKCPEYEITHIKNIDGSVNNSFLNWEPGNDYDIFQHPVKNKTGKNNSLS